MAGGLTISTLNDSSGVLATQNGMLGVAKAWVNFNGVSGVSIYASFNVSSVTRNATGNYTVNFTTAMPDANYTMAGSSYADGNSSAGAYVGYGPSVSYPLIKSTTQFRFLTQEGGGALRDGSQVSVVVNR